MIKKCESLVLLLLVIGCVPACLNLSAQGPGNERAVIQHYTAADRIPNAITDLAFDNQGNIWLTTDNDNIRIFDGTHVRMLATPDVKGTPQFAFSRVMKDARGIFYFLTRDKQSLFRMNKAGQLSYDSVLSASTLTAGSNWCFFNWDRFISNGEGDDARKGRQVLKSRLFNNKTVTAFNDSTFIFNEGGKAYLYKDGQLRVIGDHPIEGVNAALIDGQLFVLETNRFVHIDGQSGKRADVALMGDILSDSLYKAGRGALALFISAHPHIVCNNRLYRLRCPGGTALEAIFVCELGALRFPVSKVEYDPRQGISAFSCTGDGLFIVRPSSFPSSRHTDSFLTLKKKRIFYPVALKDSNIFLTSWGEFSGSGYFKPLDLQHPGPKCLFTDHAGNIWEGIENKVIRYDRHMVKEVEIVLPPSNRSAKDICENERGDILCLSDRGVLKYENGIFKDMNPFYDSVSGKICCFQAFKPVGDGVFWISSVNGLYAYNERTNRIDRVRDIPDVFTLNIMKLSDGAVLVTCYPQSFYFIYYKKRFFKIPVDMDLPLKETSSVLEYRKGRVWFATSGGLFVTTRGEIEAYCDGKKRSIYYYRYDKKEGLQELEFNGGLNASNCMSADGYLVFNSMSGVFIFHQDSIRQEFPGGEIRLSTLRMDDEETPARDTIALEHDNNGMPVQVSVPYFGSKDNLQLEYKITPGMDVWKAVDAQGRITVGHLSHGNYVLSVRARNGLGPRDYLTKTAVIEVPPLFYETILFRSIAGIVLVSACVLATIAIIRLRKEVRMKNASLYDKNDRLQRALSELEENISLKEKLISLILHDLKTPLYFQSLLFNKIVEADHFTNQEGRELFQELKKSSAGILQFTKDFLTWYSIQRDGFKVKKTEFDYLLIVNDLFSVYADIAAKKNLVLQSKSIGVESLYTDRNILEIIIRNLLDNAIKYTSTGGVTLLFEKRDEGDAIIVADTGKGMTPEKIEVLEGEKFGYRFIYAMAGKIGAEIQIDSKPGGGTSVTITIPHARYQAGEPKEGIN